VAPRAFELAAPYPDSPKGVLARLELLPSRRRYAPFEFAGAHDADVIVVSFGPAARVFEGVAHSPHSNRLGAVTVRMLHP
jgi:pyruvate/2-oxoacid:ferredoxin oxidoreductase alpha subunit